MFLVIPAKDDVTVTVVLPTGLRDHDEAAAAALAPFSRGVLTATAGPDGTTLEAFLASRGAAAAAAVGHETLAFRCRMPLDAAEDCLPAFLAAVADPAPAAGGDRPQGGDPHGEDPADARRAAHAMLRELLFADHPLARTASGRSGTPGPTAPHGDVPELGTPVVVVAAPDGRASAVLEILEKALPGESAPAGPDGREAPPLEVFSTGGLNLRSAAGAARARVAAGGIAAARTDRAAVAALRVLAELLGDGAGSALRRTLNTDVGIDCAPEATYEGYQDCGLFQVELDLDTADVAIVESLVRELLELTAAGRLGEAAFLAARTAAADRAAAEASDVPLASYRAAVEALDGDGAGDPAGRPERVTREELASAAAGVLRTYSVAVV
ncbi:insulinase family protein [Streptomyces sp. NPDC058052]|uniref:insulinase family protein n=1 Tax=Streptomyces sp. NPDC058052 TaxID=3346316 RepID=UPI0036EA0445